MSTNRTHVTIDMDADYNNGNSNIEDQVETSEVQNKPSNQSMDNEDFGQAQMSSILQNDNAKNNDNKSDKNQIENDQKNNVHNNANMMTYDDESVPPLPKSKIMENIEDNEEKKNNNNEFFNNSNKKENVKELERQQYNITNGNDNPNANNNYDDDNHSNDLSDDVPGRNDHTNDNNNLIDNVHSKPSNIDDNNGNDYDDDKKMTMIDQSHMGQQYIAQAMHLEVILKLSIMLMLIQMRMWKEKQVVKMMNLMLIQCMMNQIL